MRICTYVCVPAFMGKATVQHIYHGTSCGLRKGASGQSMQRPPALGRRIPVPMCKATVQHIYYAPTGGLRPAYFLAFTLWPLSPTRKLQFALEKVQLNP